MTGRHARPGPPARPAWADALAHPWTTAAACALALVVAAGRAW